MIGTSAARIARRSSRQGLTRRGPPRFVGPSLPHRRPPRAQEREHREARGHQSAPGAAPEGEERRRRTPTRGRTAAERAQRRGSPEGSSTHSRDSDQRLGQAPPREERRTRRRPRCRQPFERSPQVKGKRRPWPGTESIMPGLRLGGRPLTAAVCKDGRSEHPTSRHPGRLAGRKSPTTLTPTPSVGAESRVGVRSIRRSTRSKSGLWAVTTVGPTRPTGRSTTTGGPELARWPRAVRAVGLETGARLMPGRRRSPVRGNVRCSLPATSSRRPPRLEAGEIGTSGRVKIAASSPQVPVAWESVPSLGAPATSPPRS